MRILPRIEIEANTQQNGKYGPEVAREDEPSPSGERVTDRWAQQAGWLTEAHTMAGKEAGNGREVSIVGTKGSSLLS